MEKDVAFLEEKVRCVIEPMINGVFKDNPEDPVKYMIRYLNHYIGISNETSTEKEELIKLRKEMAKYKGNGNEEDKEAIAQSEDEENDKEDQDQFDKEIEEKTKKGPHEKFSAQRISVCSEVVGEYNKKADYVPKVIPKTDEQKEKIKNKMLQNFMFSNLDEAELQTVLDAFEEKKVTTGETVIKEGDKGDVVYLVETGELTCTKKQNGKEVELKTYVPGESFGELALLYNAPRAATIVAKTDAILWSLDRECFNSIVKGAAIKKRERYESVLKTVEILQTIDAYELSQICDALKVEKVKEGTKIITQNEEGNKFYILEEGEAYATKEIEGKECILDVKLTLNNDKVINIELQVYKQTYWINRSLLYWARTYDNLKSGQDYSMLLPAYHIGILDFTLFENHPKFMAQYQILDVEDGYLYSDKLCIKVLDLTQLEKAKQEPETNKKLLKWASIFKAETLEELEQLARGEEVFENMVVTMKKLSEDEKIRMQCEAREDYERSLLTEYNAGKSEGIEQGIASERRNTEKERQRAEKESQRAEALAAEVERLRALLK